MVPQSHGRRPVARCDDAFDIVPRQMTGQCREPLQGNRRHRTDKPGPAKAVQHEEAQIQPKRRRLASDKFARCRLKAVLHRIPDQRRAVSIGVVAKMGKKHPHGLVVALYGPLTNAAIAPQPDQESRHMAARILARRRWARRGDARADQVVDEQADLRSAVVAAREAAGPDEEVGMRTGAVVRQKPGEDIVVDLRERDIVQVEPDDEVSTALAVGGDRLGHISLCHECLKERLHHTAAALDRRGHPHASRLHEEAQEPVQMPSAAFEVLAVTALTGTGTVVAQESIQNANVERLDPCPLR